MISRLYKTIRLAERAIRLSEEEDFSIEFDDAKKAQSALNWMSMKMPNLMKACLVDQQGNFIHFIGSSGEQKQLVGLANQTGGSLVESRIREATWKSIGRGSYEMSSGKYDFAITKTGDGKVVLDIFDSSIKDPDEAHIDSMEFNSVDAAKKEAESWK